MSKRTAVYRLYDKGDRLIYVGTTGDPAKRFRQHQTGKSWWEEVATREIEWFPDADTALRAERELIASELPPHNVRSMPWHPELGQKPEDSMSITGLVSSPYAAVNHVLGTGRPLVITKHGRPVLVLASYGDQDATGR